MRLSGKSAGILGGKSGETAGSDHGKTVFDSLIIRHGQTEANRDGVIQGQGDSPLTAAGIEATRLKARKISRFAIDRVYCSDLPRAVATYDIMKEEEPSLPEAVYCRDLREIDFGSLAGRHKEEILPLILRHKADTSLRYPGGESGDDLRERVVRFFTACRSSYPGEVVLIITHYGVMETLARQFAGVARDDSVAVGEEDVWWLRFSEMMTARLDVL